MAALSFQHVTKLFPGDILAVDDLTLDIGEGESLAVVGPSGCGKTTVLRIIAGLETPTRGAVMIDDQPANGMPPRRRNVAMVFQQSALYPHLSVRGNMAFGLKMRGEARAEIDRRVNEAAAMLRIEHLLGRRPGELSGGQQQRVALGRAMVRRPRLLLMDEPLSNLDSGLRAQLRHEIRRLHARLGVAMIYVTHDQAEAATLGQRIAVLRGGRLQQAADPQTIYHRPANRFVAGLMGSRGMNFLEGRVEGGRWKAKGCPWEVAIPEPWRKAMARHDGRAVVLGIRPEHLTAQADERQTDGARIPAVVEAIGRIGPEIHVNLLAGDRALVCRVEGDFAPRTGQQIMVALAMEHIHFFDGKTGEAVRCSGC